MDSFLRWWGREGEGRGLGVAQNASRGVGLRGLCLGGGAKVEWWPASLALGDWPIRAAEPGLEEAEEAQLLCPQRLLGVGGYQVEVRDPARVEAMLMAQARPLQDAHDIRRPLQASLPFVWWLLLPVPSSFSFPLFSPWLCFPALLRFSFLFIPSSVYFLCRLPLAPRMGWHLVYCLSLFLPLLPALFVPTLLRWSPGPTSPPPSSIPGNPLSSRPTSLEASATVRSGLR